MPPAAVICVWLILPLNAHLVRSRITVKFKPLCSALTRLNCCKSLCDCGDVIESSVCLNHRTTADTVKPHQWTTLLREQHHKVLQFYPFQICYHFIIVTKTSAKWITSLSGSRHQTIIGPKSWTSGRGQPYCWADWRLECSQIFL